MFHNNYEYLEIPFGKYQIGYFITIKYPICKIPYLIYSYSQKLLLIIGTTLKHVRANHTANFKAKPEVCISQYENFISYHNTKSFSHDIIIYCTSLTRTYITYIHTYKMNCKLCSLSYPNNAYVA